MKKLLTLIFSILFLTVAHAQDKKESFEGKWVADFDKLKLDLTNSDWYKKQSKEEQKKALEEIEPYKRIIHIFTKTTSTMIGPEDGAKSTLKVTVTKIKENKYSINYSEDLKAVSIINGDKMTQHTVFKGDIKQTIYLKRKK